MNDDDKKDDMSGAHKQGKPAERRLYTDNMMEAQTGYSTVEKRTTNLNQRWKETADCVDGRLTLEQILSNPDKASFAVPGGGLGIELILITAAERAGIPREGARKTTESVIGIPTGHTDTHSHNPEHDVAGCGFCNGIMLDSAYDVDSDLQEWFLRVLVPGSVQKGMKSKVLEGDHREGAVIIVHSDPKGTGEFRNMPHEIGEDLQAFVFHVDEYNALLEHAARRIYRENPEAYSSRLDEQAFVDSALEIAGEWLQVVLRKLAKPHNLPFYEVNLDGTYKEIEFDYGSEQ